MKRLREFSWKTFMIVVFVLSLVSVNTVLSASPLFVTKAHAQTVRIQTKSTQSIYNPNIPMPKAQQEYLYTLTKQRGLDYKETLAVIKHESSFRPNAKNGQSYGYFQIGKVNHATLSKLLKTANKPLDPYVNMNWGTHMLSELTKKYQKQGYTGTRLKEAVLSAYNKGEYGYKKTGKAVSYINGHNLALSQIKRMFS